MTFEATLSQVFPGAMPDREFISKTQQELGKQGHFTAENSIACVGVCRDEITRPFVRLIEQAWGEAFNFSSLAGMLFMGKTGLKAAWHHAPKSDRPCFVYFILAHIGITADGKVGQHVRVGQEVPSSACGALSGLVGKLDRKSYNLDVDISNIEVSLLKWKLIHLGENQDYQGIVSLTKLTYAIILADLKRLISQVEEEEKLVDGADYAVLSGIQIHSPYGYDFIWPGEMYAIVNGRHEKILLDGMPQ
jgi:hypothetical protein